LFTAALAAASVFDLKRRMIPDRVCAVVALAGLMGFGPAKLSGTLAALPFLAAATVKEGSVGGGDIKLTAAAGLTLGFAGGVAGVILALAAELLFAAGTAAWTGRLRGRVKTLPFAPFLSAGFLAVYFWKR
jgi:leader peptidase (prepilin peptidase)/N-methyltransferase